MSEKWVHPKWTQMERFVCRSQSTGSSLCDSHQAPEPPICCNSNPTSEADFRIYSSVLRLRSPLHLLGILILLSKHEILTNIQHRLWFKNNLQTWSMARIDEIYSTSICPVVWSKQYPSFCTQTLILQKTASRSLLSNWVIQRAWYPQLLIEACVVKNHTLRM